MEITQFIKDNSAYFEDLVTRSIYNSNKIEGNTLSYAETYSIVFNREDVRISASPREFYEAINHKYALDYIFGCNDQLQEKDLIQIAIRINKNINEISGYRTSRVYIQGAEHIPPEPNEIKQKMMYFMHNYNADENPNIFEKIAQAHIQFERIHPFSDGNGRTGRILILHELLRNNLPPAVIDIEKKQTYLNFIEAQDFLSLARLLKELSDKEMDRIQKFQK